MAQDLAKSTFTNNADKAISNTGWETDSSINTGNGNDTITGYGKYGIILDKNSTINTGDGKDTVDALEASDLGFDNDGTIHLGAGNDILKGFGFGKFYGGTGKDKILLGKGKYKVSDSKIVGTVRGDWEKITAYEFEKIGGVNGGLFDFKDGTLTIDSKGVGTFA